MSGLSDVDILCAIQEGQLMVSPLRREHVTHASIDLCLGTQYQELIDGTTLDSHSDNSECFLRKAIGDRLVLQPNTFILGETYEWLSLSRGLVGHLSGRSSLGRLGITVHITAGVVDPGWRGKLTLEIKNLTNGPVILYPGDRVAQLVLTELRSQATPYAGKYQNADGPQVSRMYQDKV